MVKQGVRDGTGYMAVTDSDHSTMASGTASVTDSSRASCSAATHSESNLAQEVSESGVPELDNDLSTDDQTSEYLSTRTTSYMPSLEVDDVDDVYGSIHMDTTSIYSPSHYPSISAPYRVERPWEEETLDSTRSITDLDLDYVIENGRRYCGSYYMPNDEDEQVRLQLINQVYLKAFEGELTSIPLECPTHILDIGTAAGEWAIDMAEAYPECEITGTDISNIFERQAPPNVFWEIDDAELDWERPVDYYDLVHLRNMAGSFSNWESIFRSALRCLKPGGWLEVLDFDDHKGMRNFYSFFEPGSLIHKMAQDVQEASIMSGKPRGTGHLEPRFLVNAGYVDVQLTEHAIPLRTEDGSTGKFWLLAMLNGIESTCLRLLTKHKGWKAEDVRIAADMIGQEMMSMALNPRRAKGFVVKVRVLTGRKPGHYSVWSTEPISESGEVMKPRGSRESMGEESRGDGESGYGSYGYQGAAAKAEDKPSRSPQISSDLMVESETISDVLTDRDEGGEQANHSMDGYDETSMLTSRATDNDKQVAYGDPIEEKGDNQHPTIGDAMGIEDQEMPIRDTPDNEKSPGPSDAEPKIR